MSSIPGKCSFEVLSSKLSEENLIYSSVGTVSASPSTKLTPQALSLSLSSRSLFFSSLPEKIQCFRKLSQKLLESSLPPLLTVLPKTNQKPSWKDLTLLSITLQNGRPKAPPLDPSPSSRKLPPPNHSPASPKSHLLSANLVFSFSTRFAPLIISLEIATSKHHYSTLQPPLSLSYASHNGLQNPLPA